MSNDMSATKQFPESITANVLRGYSVQCSMCTICAGLAAKDFNIMISRDSANQRVDSTGTTHNQLSSYHTVLLLIFPCAFVKTRSRDSHPDRQVDPIGEY